MSKGKCRHPSSFCSPKERLSRFIFEPTHIRNGVNQSVFKTDKSNTLSVYRTTKCSASQIWEICSTYVDKPDRKYIALAKLEASDYIKLNLNFDLNGKPHRRHINVIGWDTQKPNDHDRRVELAQKAKLFMRSN